MLLYFLILYSHYYIPLLDKTAATAVVCFNLFFLNKLVPSQCGQSLSDQNFLCKSTFECECCDEIFTSYKIVFDIFMKGLKGGISINADSGPLRYLL